MNRPKDGSLNSAAISDIYFPKTDYLSQDFANAEAEYLWPKVWQIACRLEEIPNVGDFVTYDIVDDSIIVVRTALDEIRAHHNTCPHRGTRLTDGCGKLKQFVCPFHGWRYKLDGQNIHVTDEKDWKGQIDKNQLGLSSVKVDTWAGWIWINMDEDALPLHEFLAPVIERCDNFNFQDLRFRWYKTIKLPVNWKVSLEAFNEAYHVPQTHPEVLEYNESYSTSMAYGPHGAFASAANPKTGLRGISRSSRIGGPHPGVHPRDYILAYVEDFNNELKAMVTERTYQATQQLKADLYDDATEAEVMMAWARFQREACIEDGAKWPDFTPEYRIASNSDWHLFPNTIFLHSGIDGVIWYRSRPDGTNPDSSLFDVWSLEQYGPGKEPPLVREYCDDWRDAKWGRILDQDFKNMPLVQRGMKSRGFQGSRTNPAQEIPVSNFHRALHEHIEAVIAAKEAS